MMHSPFSPSPPLFSSLRPSVPVLTDRLIAPLTQIGTARQSQTQQRRYDLVLLSFVPLVVVRRPDDYIISE
jgi:hypothetical protein